MLTVPLDFAIGPALAEHINRVPQTELVTLVEQINFRFDQYATLVSLPADHLEHKVFLENQGKLVNASKKPENRVMWWLDSKNYSRSYPNDAFHATYRCFPGIMEKWVENFLVSLFGPKDMPADERVKGSLLGQLGCEHVVLIFDGRRAAITPKLRTLLGKVGGKTHVSLFRLNHSNTEFVAKPPIQARIGLRNGGDARGTGRQWSNLPDPLETIVVYVSPSVNLDHRPLIWVGVPGTTMAGGLSNVPMKYGMSGESERKREDNLWTTLGNMRAATAGMVGSRKPTWT